MKIILLFLTLGFCLITSVKKELTLIVIIYDKLSPTRRVEFFSPIVGEDKKKLPSTVRLANLLLEANNKGDRVTYDERVFNPTNFLNLLDKVELNPRLVGVDKFFSLVNSVPAARRLDDDTRTFVGDSARDILQDRGTDWLKRVKQFEPKILNMDINEVDLEGKKEIKKNFESIIRAFGNGDFNKVIFNNNLENEWFLTAVSPLYNRLGKIIGYKKENPNMGHLSLLKIYNRTYIRFRQYCTPENV